MRVPALARRLLFGMGLFAMVGVLTFASLALLPEPQAWLPVIGWIITAVMTVNLAAAFMPGLSAQRLSARGVHPRRAAMTFGLVALANLAAGGSALAADFVVGAIAVFTGAAGALVMAVRLAFGRLEAQEGDDTGSSLHAR